MLDKQFYEYYKNPRSCYTTAQIQEESLRTGFSPQTIEYWAKDAYYAGIEAMAQETLAMLLLWATQLEGLDPEIIEPCEKYDSAHASLRAFYRDVLGVRLNELD